jgi:hypothetical protein
MLGQYKNENTIICKNVQISITQAFILFRCLTQLENFRGRGVVVVVQ